MPYEEEEEALPYVIVSTDEAKRMIEEGAHVIEAIEDAYLLKAATRPSGIDRSLL